MEDNIRMNLEEIDVNVGNWVDSAQHRDYFRALMSAGYIRHRVNERLR